MGTASLAGAKPPYKVWGYLMGGDVDPRTLAAINLNNLPWASLTHVMDSFALPSATVGKITTTNLNGSALVTAAHANATRCNMSIGGAFPTANTTRFNNSVNSPANIATFVANITTTVQTMGYDGVDIDWEFPTAAQKTNFMSFMQALYAAVKAMPPAYDSLPRDVTFFISAGGSICGVDWASIGNYCDSGIMSGYDYFIDVYNGPLGGEGNYTDCAGTSASGDIKGTYAKIHGAGMPANKLSLGCPLYGNLLSSGNEVEIIKLLQTGTAGAYQAFQAEQLYTYGGDQTTANTAQSFCDKINWALAQGMQGIGLWEIAQAYPPTDPLVSGIWSTIGGSNGCLVLGSPTPTSTRTSVANTATSTPTRTVVPATATPTPSSTALPSTATSTATHTALPATATPTPSSTALPSTATSTPTRTALPATATSTPTASGSPSPLASPSASPSPLPGSPTDSPTPGAIATASPSVTGSPVPSATPSATVVSTQAATPSATPNSSVTFTPNVMATSSPSGTPNSSATDSPSATPSGTPVSSATATPVATATSSAVPSLSASPSPVPPSPTVTVPVPSPTDTPFFLPPISPTQSVTPLATLSPSPSATPPAPSATATPTVPPPASATPSFTPGGPGSPYGPPQILQAAACPNPVQGAHWVLALKLSSPADQLTLKVYTPALVAVGSQPLSGSWAQGWAQAAWLQDLPPGLYYAVLTAGRAGVNGPHSRAIKVVLLP